MMIAPHIQKVKKTGISIKLHRGEGKVLIGFNLDKSKATKDFVGFALEYREPKGTNWIPVKNRLRFSYDGLTDEQKSAGASSLEAPIQKFRWIHFPHNRKDGDYKYRATAMYMEPDGSLRAGASVEAKIDLSGKTIPNLVDVGFTRGYASSQAYANRERFPCQQRILPAPGTPPPGDLAHDMTQCVEEYAWLGFESRQTIYDLLDEALSNAQVSVDALLYELREPQIVAKLEALGPRLRAIVDDHEKHGDPSSNETTAAKRLTIAGAEIKRGHFARQQHNKVLILRRNGTPYKALAGSTNFTLRGLYVQSNNTLVFTDRKVPKFFANVFERYFEVIDQARATSKFKNDPLSQSWHDLSPPTGPKIMVAVSPHKDASLSLAPIAKAIESANSSVLYAVVFLNQLTGQVRDALEDLVNRSTFSYGVSQRKGGLAVEKPDGSRGLVSFDYLAANAPEPFASEWSSNAGGESRSNVLHHKFIVTDFNTPNAKVFTGSSNFAAGGEQENGDHIIMIEDQRIATAYAVEALRIFDHFHFRTSMVKADRLQESLKLARPPSVGSNTWFRSAYVNGHIKQRDRLLFGD
jgi:phosphatidylserine/phosphatidylglycerophosphate/cardiolipin synthase-like enzyme